MTISGGKKYEKDLSFYTRGIPRPALEGRKVWKFQELKDWLLTCGPEVEAITELPKDSELGLMDPSEGGDEMALHD